MSKIAETYHCILPHISLEQLESEVANMRWICEDCLHVQEMDDFVDCCDKCWSSRLHVSYLDGVEHYLEHLKKWKEGKNV